MKRPRAGLPFILMNSQEERMMKTKGVLPTILAFIVAVMLAAAPAFAQQITGTPGSPSATETIDGKYLPPPPAKFGGEINLERQAVQAVLAAQGRAAEGRAQCAADHDRRRGLWRLGHVRRRHPDADPGPDRQHGSALHAGPFDGTVLADAGGTDHRPQPSLGGLRCDLRAVDRLSRI